MSLLMLFVLLSRIFSFAAHAEDVLPVNWQGLPEPYQTASSVNPPHIITRPKHAQLTVPVGFQVTEYLDGFSAPRYMIHGIDDEILLSDMDAGIIYRIQDQKSEPLLKGLSAPYGLALYNKWIYIADAMAVRRYVYDGQKIDEKSVERIVNLQPYASGHITRTLLFDKEKRKFYLSVGSRTNNELGEPSIRAAITRFNPDGSGQELFATGLRNAVGMAWNPLDNSLWVTCHERDGLGDDLVPDYFTQVNKSDFFGWPYAYIGPHEDPRHKNVAHDKVKQSRYPNVLLGSHVGALDAVFYTGKQFPESFRNGAFIALHGSWNRSKRVGYKIVHVAFQKGKPVSGPVDFLTGWMVSTHKRSVWGRPVGLLQMPDGSLLVTDDGAGKIWRIHYESD